MVLSVMVLWETGNVVCEAPRQVRTAPSKQYKQRCNSRRFTTALIQTHKTSSRCSYVTHLTSRHHLLTSAFEHSANSFCALPLLCFWAAFFSFALVLLHTVVFRLVCHLSAAMGPPTTKRIKVCTECLVSPPSPALLETNVLTTRLYPYAVQSSTETQLDR